jgi:hypothetical protein
MNSDLRLLSYTLGAGKLLFIDIKERVGLALIDTKVFSTGLVLLRYQLDKDKVPALDCVSLLAPCRAEARLQQSKGSTLPLRKTISRKKSWKR